MIALQGAGARNEANRRIAMTAGYLSGVLSGCDPQSAPSLEDILDPVSDDAAAINENVDPSQNARAWVATLKALNKTAARKSGSQKEGENA
ncbi:hypothetical protein [Erythrobacter rubeus]|uniref:Uncharacterized protein n=1 Tax=Erythrobacter rubeus TaxID=2760803 RepID=A0ABR8KPV2_9SPHN|nr:hypothetical protein [Erythrobacter rubeus]MBD2842709.1 hypothetical protein [Erythrobacter rubeus]